MAAILAVVVGCAPSADPPDDAPAGGVDLRPRWDRDRVLENPDKGWYQHYFDDGLEAYASPEADLERVPGLDHLYLRIPWSDLEPAEGVYRWDLIDDLVGRWAPAGVGIAVRVTAYEPDSREYATPRWVEAAGAVGHRREVRPGRFSWQPEWTDPVYFAKFAAFHRAFGARYDGAPWLRYVDLGFFGYWGEGHTFPMLPLWTDPAPGELLPRWLDRPPPTSLPDEDWQRWVDAYRSAYPRTQLVISDDAVMSELLFSDDGERSLYLTGSGLPVPGAVGEAADRAAAAWAQGLTVRDDSLGVGRGRPAWDEAATPLLLLPELFDAVWRDRPTILETEHYGQMRRNGFWSEPNGGVAGEMLEATVVRSRATYLSLHGWVDEWLDENPRLVARLANRLGYWFLPERVRAPQSLAAGDLLAVDVDWANLGAAPAYEPYEVRLGLEAVDGSIRWLEPVTGDPRRWLPDATTRDRYRPRVPIDVEPGRYHLVVRLTDRSGGGDRPVELGLRITDRTTTGAYRLTDLDIDP